MSIKHSVGCLALASIVCIGAMLQSCSSSRCTEKPEGGNLGMRINSTKNDFIPRIFEKTLYFSTNRNGEREDIYSSAIRHSDEIVINLATAVKDDKLPFKGFYNFGSPTFFKDTANNRLELYFAASDPVKKTNIDLFYSVNQNGEWSKPENMGESINTLAYESHPYISPNGSYLVFTSDREGGQGETDLYVTFRSSTGEWAKAINLGKGINTKYSEMTPFIAETGDLYYTSKSYAEGANYDIMKAEHLDKGQWKSPKVMPAPYNSEYNEISPVIYNGRMYFASDKPGGCGEYDLFSVPICAPVLLEGKVITGDLQIKPEGTVEIINQDSSVITKTRVASDGTFKLENIVPYNTYTINYQNECLKEFKANQQFTATCSDTSVIKFVTNFNLPENLQVFTTEKYRVPFFVSGYYYPNTTTNLATLRNRFQYGLLGNNDTTRYIENPGNEYDEYADSVDKALNEATEFILKRLSFLSTSCTDGKERLSVKITGFADPRPLSELAKYDGMDIDDEATKVHVTRGQQMTNELLSSLRAYYTARFIQVYLSKYKSYNENTSRIKWIISGEGVDETNALPNEFRRKVKIDIGVIVDES